MDDAPSFLRCSQLLNIRQILSILEQSDIGQKTIAAKSNDLFCPTSQAAAIDMITP
jgi:hypothetical protein